MMRSSDYKLDTDYASGLLFELPYRSSDFFLHSEASDESNRSFRLGQKVYLGPSHDSFSSQAITVIDIPANRSDPYTVQTSTKDILQVQKEDILPHDPSGNKQSTHELPILLHHPWLKHRSKITARFPGMDSSK